MMISIKDVLFYYNFSLTKKLRKALFINYLKKLDVYNLIKIKNQKIVV